MKSYSWGCYPSLPASVQEVWWRDDLESKLADGMLLPVGLGRSYGDSCLLDRDSGDMLSLIRCNRLLSFNSKEGVIEVEAGCSLSKLVDWSMKRGFFPPVVPGTSSVTVGGAISNDIHGKNHHAAGTFGRWVQEFELLRSGKGWVICSPKDNRELFQATIGGLGLTGVIGRVKLKLEKIEGEGLIEQEAKRFSTLREASDLLSELDQDYPMTVAWIDMGSSSKGRGVAMGGRFASGAVSPPPSRRLKMPVRAPSWVLNPLTIRAFNSFYSLTRKEGLSQMPYSNYFFPLDGIGNWNLLYGKRGFLQYQCVVPLDEISALEKISQKVSDFGQGAFLSVLKKFGGAESPGWLSFPMEGWTLAMDFPMKGPKTLEMLKELDREVREVGGRLYPAKDARMAGDFFRESYPSWSRLEAVRDPRINSEFWKRVAK